jgi:hypothetical protein
MDVSQGISGGEAMFPQWEYLDFGDNGPQYGNYGGLNYSAGTEGGTVTGTPADPAPVDLYDQAFYAHDLALQEASNPVERLEAHVEVAQTVYGLLSDAASGWHIL